MTLAYMANGSTSGIVKIIDTSSDELLQPTSGIVVGNAPYGVAFTPDGLQAVVTNTHHNATGSTGTISFIDAVSGAVLATINPGGLPNGVVIAKSGSNIYAYVAVEDSYTPASGTDFVAIYNMADYSLVTTKNIDQGAMPYGIAATPDNSYVYIACSYDNGTGAPGQVAIIRTSDNTLIHNFPIVAAGSGYQSYAIAITPDGNTVYVTLRRTPTATGQVAYFPADGNSHSVASIHYVGVSVEPQGIAITPDSGTVYVANYGNHGASPTAPSIAYFATGASSANYLYPVSSSRPFGRIRCRMAPRCMSEME